MINKFVLIFSIISFFLLSKSDIYAGKYPGGFESVSYRQEWLIPNDYSTSMNPPSCKLREPTNEEISELSKECGEPSQCPQLVEEWVKQWDANICAKIGMSIGTSTDGKKFAYFEKKDEDKQPLVDSVQGNQNVHEQKNFWDMLKSFFSNLKNSLLNVFN